MLEFSSRFPLSRELGVRGKMFVNSLLECEIVMIPAFEGIGVVYYSSRFPLVRELGIKRETFFYI